MTAINPLLNLNTPLTNEQIEANKEVDAQQKLQQEDFFALLSQQLAYQDPFKPVDNSEMIAQMASFTTAEGITTMGTEFAGMKEVLSSSQALQASSLVGKKVLIPSNQGYLAETGGIDGSINSATGAYGAMVSVENSAGVVVRTISLGDIGAGNKRFSWDGLDNAGERLPEDTYTFNANGTVNGQGEELMVASYAHVQSVSLGGGQAGVYLNLQGLGGIELSDAIEVAENK
ncbi:flagellar biosynthesis protein FlgD [Psychromonas sp. psych-6C06]|uniref:flagellar hook assembly protein FlgD n=1 Tax=Psychromonas sp. psych-6C06 TaxID=2058089 RepID=UPI000C3394AC|nr:flagellar hook assembly protein FlgD [Psychromonas sp. psych-6C06]PKF62768.1 flagellar biosynthesis protein FlgD [Psychromonas sp. psych-6C06]